MNVAPHLFEQLDCCGEIGLDQSSCQLEIDGERDELLLDSVVKIALDLAAFGVGGGEETGGSRADLVFGWSVLGVHELP